VALHPKERKRLKRQKVKEVKRRHAARRSESERLEDYYWIAVECYEDGDRQGALKWADKILQERPTHKDARDLALHSAELLGDMDKCLSLLVWRWREGLIGNWKDRFHMGKLALERKEYRLAVEIFESVLKDPMLNSGWKKKQHVNEVQTHLRYAEAMLQAESPQNNRSTAQEGHGYSRSGGIKTGTPSELSTLPIGHKPSGAANATAAAARCKPASPAAVETLPDIKIE